MGLKNLTSKMADYTSRMEAGKTSKIKPDHVEKVRKKLEKQASELEGDIAQATSSEKKARLERKLAIARAQIDRADWLLKELR